MVRWFVSGFSSADIDCAAVSLRCIDGMRVGTNSQYSATPFTQRPADVAGWDSVFFVGAQRILDVLRLRRGSDVVAGMPLRQCAPHAARRLFKHNS